MQWIVWEGIEKKKKMKLSYKVGLQKSVYLS